VKLTPVLVTRGRRLKLTIVLGLVEVRSVKLTIVLVTRAAG
jgi:hypothetical protein